MKRWLGLTAGLALVFVVVACSSESSTPATSTDLDAAANDARADARDIQTDGNILGDGSASDASLEKDAHTGDAARDAATVIDARADATDAAVVADAAVDAPTACLTAPAKNWQAIARTENGEVVIELLELPPKGGLSASLLVYKGPPSGVGQLPQSRAASCTPGAVVCDPRSWMNVNSQNYHLFSGTITLSRVSSPLSSEVKVDIGTLEFRETYCAPIEGGCITTFKPNGRCYTLPASSIDTAVAIGTPCSRIEDCGTLGKECSITSNTCVASQCSKDSDCGAGQACITQHRPYTATDGLIANACHTKCDPTAPGACGANAECIRRPHEVMTAGEWICTPTGTAALGAVCSPDPSTNSTGCVKGATCVHWPGAKCVKRCNPLDVNPGCAASERCVIDGCVTPIASDPAAIGQTCAAPGQRCGDDGKAYRGICDGSLPSSVCRAVCEVGGTCVSGTCKADAWGPACK